MAAQRARDARYRALVSRTLWLWLGGLLLVEALVALAAVNMVGTVPAPLLVALCAVFVTGLAAASEVAGRRARRQVAREYGLASYDPPEDGL
jgi:hypothetical protein